MVHVRQEVRGWILTGVLHKLVHVALRQPHDAAHDAGLRHHLVHRLQQALVSGGRGDRQVLRCGTTIDVYTSVREFDIMFCWKKAVILRNALSHNVNLANQKTTSFVYR